MAQPKRVPYNPFARDADGDGVLQEFTVWERPVGTRYVDPNGNELTGVTRSPSQGFRIVNAENQDVNYTPKPLPQDQQGGQPSGLPTLNEMGAKPIGEQMGTIGEAGATLQK